MSKKGIKDYFSPSTEQNNMGKNDKKTSKSAPPKATAEEVERYDKVSRTASHKHRIKVERVEIDPETEKDLPISFFEFLEYTNVLNIVDLLKIDARKSKSKQYSKDMTYAKTLARRLYGLYYTKINYRKKRPLVDIKVTENCPDDLRERIMSIPPKYDVEQKRNNNSLENIPRKEPNETITKDQNLPSTSHSKKSKMAAELQNIESLSISSGDMEHSTETTAPYPPPPPFSVFKKLVNMDEEFENHLTSLCNGNIAKIEEYRRISNVRHEFEYAFYKKFYSQKENRRRLNWKLRPCPQNIRQQILTPATLDTQTGPVETRAKKDPRPLEENDEDCREDVIESFINKYGLKRDGAVSNVERDFKYPVSFDTFKAYTYHKQMAEEIFSNTCSKAAALESFKNNEFLQNSIFRQYYESFYKRPEIRSTFQIKLKSCPEDIKNRILQIPSETMDAVDASCDTELEKKDTPIPQKRRSNEGKKPLSPPTKRLRAIETDASAEKLRKRSPISTPNRVTPPRKSKDAFQSIEDKRVLPVKESTSEKQSGITVHFKRNQEESDCKKASLQKTNNNTNRNSQKGANFYPRRYSTYLTQASPKKHPNNENIKSNQVERVFTFNGSNKLSDKTMEKNRQDNVACKRNQKEGVPITDDGSTLRSKTPQKSSPQSENICDGIQEKRVLFCYDNFLKEYVRNKIDCDLSESQLNLLIKRLNEDVFEEIREKFNARQAAAAGKSQASDESIDLSSLDTSPAIEIAKQCNSSNEQAGKNNNNNKIIAEKTERRSFRNAVRIQSVKDVMLKHLNLQKTQANIQTQRDKLPEKSLAKTCALDNPLKTIKEAEKRPAHYNMDFDSAIITKHTSLTYCVRRSRGLKQKILSTVLDMSLSDFKKYTRIYGHPENDYDDVDRLAKYYNVAIVKQIWYPKLFMYCHDILVYLNDNGVRLFYLDLYQVSPKLVYYEEISRITDFDEIVAHDYFHETAKRLNVNKDKELLEQRRRVLYNKCWTRDKWLYRTPKFSEKWQQETSTKFPWYNIKSKYPALPTNSIRRDSEFVEGVEKQQNSIQRRLNISANQSNKGNEKKEEEETPPEDLISKPPEKDKQNKASASKDISLEKSTQVATSPEKNNTNIYSAIETYATKKKRSISLDVQTQCKELIASDLDKRCDEVPSNNSTSDPQKSLESNQVAIANLSLNKPQNAPFVVIPGEFGHILDSIEKGKHMIEANVKTPLPLSPNVFIASSGSTASQPHNEQEQATANDISKDHLSLSTQLHRSPSVHRTPNKVANEIAQMGNETCDNIVISSGSSETTTFIDFTRYEAECSEGITHEPSVDPLEEVLHEEQLKEELISESSSVVTLIRNYGNSVPKENAQHRDDGHIKNDHNYEKKTPAPSNLKTTEKCVLPSICRRINAIITINDSDDDEEVQSTSKVVICKKEPGLLNKLKFSQSESCSVFEVRSMASPPPIALDNDDDNNPCSKATTNLIDVLMNPTGKEATGAASSFSGLSCSSLNDTNAARFCEAQNLPSSLEETAQKTQETSEANPLEQLHVSNDKSNEEVPLEANNLCSNERTEMVSEVSDEVPQNVLMDENDLPKQRRVSLRKKGREILQSKAIDTENKKAANTQKSKTLKDTHLVPQLTHTFRALPLKTSSKQNCNNATQTQAKKCLQSVSSEDNDERENSLPSTQASAASDAAKSSSAKSFSASQQLSTDCTLFDNTQLLRDLNEMRTTQPNNKQIEVSASTSAPPQVNEQAALFNKLSEETIFHRHIYQFHYFAALNEQQVANYELPQLALGQQYMLSHIRLPSGQRIKVAGGAELLHLLFPTFSRSLLGDVFYVLNDLKEFHYNSVRRSCIEEVATFDLRERALHLLFQHAPIFCHCTIQFDSTSPEYGACLPITSAHNNSINRKPLLPLTTTLKASLLQKISQLKSQLALTTD